MNSLYEKAIELADKDMDSEALKIFEHLAAQGHIEAKIRVADCYVRGLGTEQDLEKANQYLIDAKNEGSVLAAELLSIIERRKDIEELRSCWNINAI